MGTLRGRRRDLTSDIGSAFSCLHELGVHSLVFQVFWVDESSQPIQVLIMMLMEWQLRVVGLVPETALSAYLMLVVPVTGHPDHELVAVYDSLQNELYGAGISRRQITQYGPSRLE